MIYIYIHDIYIYTGLYIFLRHVPLLRYIYISYLHTLKRDLNTLRRDQHALKRDLYTLKRDQYALKRDLLRYINISYSHVQLQIHVRYVHEVHTYT